MYHQVTEEADRGWGPWRYAVTPDTFVSHASRISERYHVIGIDEILAFLDGERHDLPSSTAVLTFDDGYADFITEALPVLEQYEIPATLYVSTSLINSSKGPFALRLANAFREVNPEAIDVPSLNIDELPADQKQAYKQLRRSLKWASTTTKKRVLETVADDTTIEYTPMVTAGQISSLANHDLITIGSHGHEHVPLTTLSRTDLQKNIEVSISRLTELLEKRPVHFSYPFGAHNEQVRRLVATAGFETAVTTVPQIMWPQKFSAKRYAIPRIDSAVYGLL
jgi:peptidoglycan/xylan/chitin deacetylase (PgdA/CDA1 family)